MYEIPNRLATPYNSICYISCEWADGTQTRASGVIVGLNDVLTAHHVVYDEDRGGYATAITIVPGADTYPFLTQPYGAFSDVGVVYARSANWDTNGDRMLYDEEAQYDLAVLGLRSPIGSTTRGWLPVAEAPIDLSGTVNGYPAAGTGQMEQPVFADASSQHGVYDINYNLGPGASGGPLLHNGAVVGVLSSGNSSQSTYAGLFGVGTWSWLHNALQADNSVMADGQAPANVLLSPASGMVSYLGTPGSDVMGSTAADENFRGDASWDVVTFSGARGTYNMGHFSGLVTVTDGQVGRDGADKLDGIERVRFSDMYVNLEVGAASRTIAPSQVKLLEELYVGFFDRVPDADGLAFWINHVRVGHSMKSIADCFYEAGLQYPTQTGYTAGMTNDDFVNVVYRNVLERNEGADPEGLAFWSGTLANGTQSRGSMVIEILASAHTFKGNPTWGWVADLLDNKAAVAHHFAVDLGLNYHTPEASITHGRQIADAVTASGTEAAIALIGVSDGFSTLG